MIRACLKTLKICENYKAFNYKTKNKRGSFYETLARYFRAFLTIVTTTSLIV